MTGRFIIIDPTLTGRPRKPADLASPKEARRQRKRAAAVEKGPGMWAELHRRALAMEGLDDTDWLTDFGLRLKWCGCRPHWQEIITAHPPTWSTYFAWTVARHNDVNTRLGKPPMTLEAARLQWSVSTPA